MANTVSVASSEFARERIAVFALKPEELMKLLQKDEVQKFGNRCADGYQKCDLLGKGGKAIVWLAQDLETGDQVALK